MRLCNRASNEGYLKVPEDFTITEKAPTLRGAFSVITNLWMDLFQDLLGTLGSVDTGLQKLHTHSIEFNHAITHPNSFSQVRFLG